MLKKLVMAPGIAILAAAVQTALAAEPVAPAAAWVPQDAVLALDVLRPKAVLDLATSPKMVATVTALPAYQKATGQPKWLEFRAGITFLEGRLGVTWPAALHKLLDGGVLVSVHPHEGVLLIAEAEDGKFLDALHDVFVEIAKGEATKSGQPDRVRSKEFQGATIWTFNGSEAHAIVGNRVMLSNRPALLKEALDLRARPAGGLAATAGYQAAKKADGPGAVATAFVNMKVIKQAPGVQKTLANDENPMAALLFAGVTDALRGADWLGLALGLQPGDISLKAATDAKPAAASTRAVFAAPPAGQGAMPNLTVPRRIAAVSLYRDLHGFYAAKDQLFPDRTSGVIFFENMMGIFFSGKDLTDEILAETRPEVRLVVAEQEYDPAIGTPRTRLPAFAAVFRMKHPEKVAEMTEEAWQKAIGLVNFTRGQKAEPGLIIDRETHEGVRLTVAYFSKAGLKGKTEIDVRYNFRPTLARVGDALVLSSTDGLAKDLIDALNKEKAEAATASRATHSLLEVDGTRLASALRVNRDAMIRQSMVEKGKTQAQAETEFDLMTTVLQHIGRAKLDLGTAQGRQEASLEVKGDLP